MAPDEQDQPEEQEPESYPLDMPQDAEPEEPPFHHTPEMVYIYNESSATSHPVLGLIEPGENQWPTEEPATVAALEAMVQAGQLEQVSPDAEEESPA